MALALPSLSSLHAPQTKKWLYPTLWFMLVLLLLHSTLSKTGHIHKAQSRLHANSSLSRPLHEVAPVGHSSSSNTLPIPNEASRLTVTANVNTSIKAAVIIETRRTAAIIPLVLHFSAVLGPDWPIIIYTYVENIGWFGTSQAMLRHQKSGRVVIRPLPPGLFFPTWDSVSQFLTQPWLWEDLTPAEQILLFQSDSVLCSNSARSVEDFFEYDYIGAPIVARFGAGYNGGLSLRRRTTILRVLKAYQWTDSPEDQWYYARMRDLQKADEENGNQSSINLPSMEVARTFAVETIDYPTPLGLHQPNRYIAEHDHILPTEDWCPEYKLARVERVFQ